MYSPVQVRIWSVMRFISFMKVADVMQNYLEPMSLVVQNISIITPLSTIWLKIAPAGKFIGVSSQAGLEVYSAA